MPILQDASPDLRRDLLDLYAVANLREAFERSGSKEEIVAEESESDDPAQIDRIIRFVGDHFGCCKQHVYAFQGQKALPTSIFGGERIASTYDSALFVTTVDFEVFTNNPLGLKTASFLWPIKVEMLDSHLVVRFVTLEKSMTARFGETSKVFRRSIDEDGLLMRWGLTEGSRADLNKAVKDLWAADWFDCTKGRYKKTFAISQDKMDPGRGIKAEYPEIYKEMTQAPIQNSLFKMLDPNFPEISFSVDPEEGSMVFQTYTKRGVSDAIIRKIMASN